MPSMTSAAAGIGQWLSADPFGRVELVDFEARDEGFHLTRGQAVGGRRVVFQPSVTDCLHRRYLRLEVRWQEAGIRKEVLDGR